MSAQTQLQQELKHYVDKRRRRIEKNRYVRSYQPDPRKDEAVMRDIDSSAFVELF